jgi:hypothetical protein
MKHILNEEVTIFIDESLNNLIDKLDEQYSAHEYVKCLFSCAIELAAELCVVNDIKEDDFLIACKALFKDVVKSNNSISATNKYDLN